MNRMMVVHRLLPGLAICLLLAKLSPKLINLCSEDAVLAADLVHCLLKLANVVNRYIQSAI